MLRMGPEIAVKSRRIMTLRDVTPKGSLAGSNNFSKGIQPNMAEYQEFFGGGWWNCHRRFFILNLHSMGCSVYIFSQILILHQQSPDRQEVVSLI